MPLTDIMSVLVLSFFVRSLPKACYCSNLMENNPNVLCEESLPDDWLMKVKGLDVTAGLKRDFIYG